MYVYEMKKYQQPALKKIYKCTNKKTSSKHRQKEKYFNHFDYSFQVCNKF